MPSDLFWGRWEMQWSNVRGTLDSQDVQTITFETVEFRTITQGQNLFCFGWYQELPCYTGKKFPCYKN